MSTELEQVIKNFTYSFPACTNQNVKSTLTLPVALPTTTAPQELMHRASRMFHLPPYLEEELQEKLTEFITIETEEYHNERDERLLNQLKNGETNVEGVVKNWEKLFKDNVVDYAEQKGTSDEEVFAAAYHKLVHSPAVETILQVENSYANAVASALKNRDEDIYKLTKRQTEEMEERVRQLNITSTEEEINDIAARHFEEQSLVAGRWGSQIDALWQTQRTEYRSWLMNTLEEYQSNSALNTPSSPLSAMPMSTSVTTHTEPPRRLEDSFTIHLGSQLKQTHNVRILAVDILDLCRPHFDRATEASRRLQTALGLYSGELRGLVLLSEGGPGRAVPPASCLVELCRASTEHHFPDVDHQLGSVLHHVKEPLERRKQSPPPSGAASSPRPRPRPHHTDGLRTGDVYVTRHSNLADTHVVFHMVADDSELKSGDINSRHPAILGLRNILKLATSHDVTSISLPALLRHHMSDEMTASWCIRRAELVLKCVKGFMLETASWGGAELRDIQFVVPAGISEDVFGTLAALLPNIFRVSTPLKIKAG